MVTLQRRTKARPYDLDVLEDYEAFPRDTFSLCNFDALHSFCNYDAWNTRWGIKKGSLRFDVHDFGAHKGCGGMKSVALEIRGHLYQKVFR